MYKIEDLPNRLEFGNQGENLVTAVQIDCASWLADYPGATMAATIILPGYGDPAPLPIEMDGAIMTIKVTRAMTQASGRGSINLRLLGAGDEEKRSAVVETFVKASHPPAEGAMPDPVQDWISEANTKLGEVDGWDFEDVDFVGDDMVFTKKNAETVTLDGAKTALKGDQGEFLFVASDTPPADTSIFWFDTSEDPPQTQTLSFDKSTSKLSISEGNTVELNKGLTAAQYQVLTDVQAKPNGMWTLITGPVYSQPDPSRDIPDRKYCLSDYGTGIVHLDFYAAATSGVVATIPSAGPKAKRLSEFQVYDGGTVWIDPESRIVKAQGLTVNKRYLFNIIVSCIY